MAAPMCKNLVRLGKCLKLQGNISRVSARTAFFSRKEKKEEKSGEELLDEADTAFLKKKTTSDALQYLKRKTSVDTVKGYTPPTDVEVKISKIAQELSGNQQVDLTDRRLKYKILTRCMTVFNHSIPNTELLNMKSLQDVINFFNTKTKQTTAYEDLSQSDLPRNLHIQLDPKRWDPETDTLFDGVTAFPGVDTKVTSIKYKNKYKSSKAKQWKTG